MIDFFKSIPCPPELPPGLRAKIAEAKRDGGIAPPSSIVQTPDGRKILVTSAEMLEMAEAMQNMRDAWFAKDEAKYRKAAKVLMPDPQTN